MNPLQLYEKARLGRLSPEEREWIRAQAEKYPYFSLLHAIEAKIAISEGRADSLRLRSVASLFTTDRKMLATYLDRNLALTLPEPSIFITGPVKTEEISQFTSAQSSETAPIVESTITGQIDSSVAQQNITAREQLKETPVRRSALDTQAVLNAFNELLAFKSQPASISDTAPVVDKPSISVPEPPKFNESSSSNAKIAIENNNTAKLSDNTSEIFSFRLQTIIGLRVSMFSEIPQDIQNQMKFFAREIAEEVKEKKKASEINIIPEIQPAISEIPVDSITTPVSEPIEITFDQNTTVETTAATSSTNEELSFNAPEKLTLETASELLSDNEIEVLSELVNENVTPVEDTQSEKTDKKIATIDDTTIVSDTSLNLQPTQTENQVILTVQDSNLTFTPSDLVIDNQNINDAAITDTSELITVPLPETTVTAITDTSEFTVPLPETTVTAETIQTMISATTEIETKLELVTANTNIEQSIEEKVTEDRKQQAKNNELSSVTENESTDNTDPLRSFRRSLLERVQIQLSNTNNTTPPVTNSPSPDAEIKIEKADIPPTSIKKVTMLEGDLAGEASMRRFVAPDFSSASNTMRLKSARDISISESEGSKSKTNVPPLTENTAVDSDSQNPKLEKNTSESMARFVAPDLNITAEKANKDKDSQTPKPEKITSESMARFVTPDFNITAEKANKDKDSQTPKPEKITSESMARFVTPDFNITAEKANKDKDSQTPKPEKITSESMMRFVIPDFKANIPITVGTSAAISADVNPEKDKIEEKSLPIDDKKVSTAGADIISSFSRFVLPEFGANVIMPSKTHTPNLETTTTAQNIIPPTPIETENDTASENLSSLPVSAQEEKTPVIVPNNTDSDQIILSNNSFKRFIELKFDPNQANQNPERISFGFERFVIPKLYTVQPAQEIKPADISSEIKIETPPSTEVPEQAITVDKPINETSNSLARFVPLELPLPTGTIDLQPTVTNITETENQAKISNFSFHTESFERFKIPDFSNTAAIMPNATSEIKVTDQKAAQAAVIETDPAVTITQSDQTTTEKVTVKPEVSPFIRVQHKSRTVEIVLPPELQDWISAQAQSTQNMPTQSSLVRESVLTDEDNESDQLRIKEIQAAAEERTRISHAFDIPSPTAKTSSLAEVEKQIQIAPILPLILDDDEKSEDKLELEQTVETVTDQNLTVIEGTAVNFDLIEEKFDAEIIPHSLTVESLAEEEIPRTGIPLSKIIEPNITPIIDTQAISSNLENLLKAREKKEEEEVQAIEPIIEEDHVHPIFIPINKPRKNPNLMRQALTNLKEIKSPSAAIKAIQQRFIDSIFNTPLQNSILSSNPIPADDEFVAEYPQVSTNVDELIEKIRIAEPQIAANRNAITSQSTQQSQSVVDNNINEELNNPEADVVISETLAKLYQQQGKIARAIEVYEQLKLLFPEKISYFEAQIASLKLL